MPKMRGGGPVGQLDRGNDACSLGSYGPTRGGSGMAGSLLRDQTPVEYFRELVGDALTRQHLRASNLTEYYLVNLLCQQIPAAGARALDETGDPLAVRLGRALDSAGRDQRSRLRRLGDFALFTSGFFPDSFRRRVVDVDYYQSIGEYAYASLSQAEDDHFSDVFSELARNFVGFTDVLSDISERTLPAADADLLRLYETWLRTGSARQGRRLLARGIVPNQSIGQRYLQ
jgi:hypothetical protein